MSSRESVEEIRELVLSGRSDLAKARLREITDDRVAQPGGHRQWGLLAEELGLFGLAEREFNLALRDDPNDIESLKHLADLAEERGALERTISLLERLMDLAPDPSTALKLHQLYLDLNATPKAAELAQRCEKLGITLPRAVPETQNVPAEPVIPADSDLLRFLSLFGGREDVYARQWFSPAKGEGGYSPVRQPLTVRELRAHLLGDVTLGVYPIRLDGTCLFCALDLDIQKKALEEARRNQSLAKLIKEELQDTTNRVRRLLQELGLQPIVEDSGYKGRHFWFPLAAPEPAGTLVALGKAVLAEITPQLGDHLACEWFPKASRPGTKGLGNLIKLPLGVHRRTGRRSVFLDEENRAIERPFEYLRQVPLLRRDVILQILDRHRIRISQAETQEQVVEDQPAASPPALPPAPLWTAQDFETSPAFTQLLGGCHVLRALVSQALEERRLSYDEVQVIFHTFGYVPAGVEAANYLFQLVGTVPKHAYLKSPLRGNPISCVKIRARLPLLTAKLPCNCVFEQTNQLYPTPILHLKPETATANKPKGSDLENLARKLLAIQSRISAWQADLAAVRTALIAALKQETQPYIDFGTFTLRLVNQDGVDTFVIEGKGEEK